MIQLTRHCPACGNAFGELLRELKCIGFDNDIILGDSRTVSLVYCCECGLVFNNTSLLQNSFHDYYDDRANNNAGTGLGAGLLSEADIKHYSQVFSILNNYCTPQKRVVDVGCGQGGFLQYLYQQGYKNVKGVDLDLQNVKYTRDELNIDVVQGSAGDIPDREVDFLVYNFIFEHIFDLREAVKSAWDSLKDEGYLFVEVPDVECYAEHPFFPHYYFALHEHINHFSSATLNKLFTDAGFSFVKSEKNIYDMGNGVLNPMIYVVYQKKGTQVLPSKREQNNSKFGAKQYLQLGDIALNKISNLTEEWGKNRNNLYIWGACLELFALLGNCDMLNCNIKAVLDSSSKKIGRTVSGIPVTSSEIISKLGDNDTVVLISTLHHLKMKELLKIAEFNGEVIDISQLALHESARVSNEQR